MSRLTLSLALALSLASAAHAQDVPPVAPPEVVEATAGSPNARLVTQGLIFGALAFLVIAATSDD